MLPASLTIQSGINSPRYATLKGIMSVKSKPVDKCNGDDFGLNLDPGYLKKIHYLSILVDFLLIEIEYF